MQSNTWETASIDYLRSVEPDKHAGLADALMRQINIVRTIAPPARVFEIGVGTGWLIAQFAERGFECAGVELNPWFIEHTKGMLRSRGLVADIRQGSIEEENLPSERYDIVLCESVLEHVPQWQNTLRAIHNTLVPGGVFHFNTSNRFAFRSGEYRRLPLYGVLPRRARFVIRRLARDQVLAHPHFFDWNQFTYWGLRRELRNAGFIETYDRFDLLEAKRRSWPKALIYAAYKRWPAAKAPLQLFDSGTEFICVK